MPSVAIPKTTAVLVILTPKPGVTPQQIMAVIPEEICLVLGLHVDQEDDALAIAARIPLADFPVEIELHRSVSAAARNAGWGLPMSQGGLPA